MKLRKCEVRHVAWKWAFGCEICSNWKDGENVYINVYIKLKILAQRP